MAEKTGRSGGPFLQLSKFIFIITSIYLRSLSQLLHIIICCICSMHHIFTLDFYFNYFMCLFFNGIIFIAF
ncbi:hypothetical protein DQ961_15490 [Salmonella bongori]|nr:hypothetical protein [Salmonella bongori]